MKNILMALLPKKKILGYVISAIIGAGALMAGINSTDLKDEVCKREPVNFDTGDKILK